jgi:hypothetical protein
MHQVLDRDSRVIFQGPPKDVESWLFENTWSYNSRLRVRMERNRTISALKYLGY